jgi:DNA-directed RNA polymerase subunit RPC12/RpoP
MIIHECTWCGYKFRVDRHTRLFAGGFLFSVSPLRWLDYFQEVVCPYCGHIEEDDRIRFFGAVSPKVYMFIVFLEAMYLFIDSIIYIVRSW